jgi:hypothetical protein
LAVEEDAAGVAAVFEVGCLPRVAAASGDSRLQSPRRAEGAGFEGQARGSGSAGGYPEVAAGAASAETGGLGQSAEEAGSTHEIADRGNTGTLVAGAVQESPCLQWLVVLALPQLRAGAS